MDNKEIQKNILDIKFKQQSQLTNASLILLTGGLLAFISTFIWFKERIFFGIGISIIISLIGLILFFYSKKKIDIIIKKINNLKD